MILWEDMVNKYPTFEVSNLEESPNNIEESKEWNWYVLLINKLNN